MVEWKKMVMSMVEWKKMVMSMVEWKKMMMSMVEWKKIMMSLVEWKKMMMSNGNAPKGQQAYSPGHRPGYEWQRFIRPERAKAFVCVMLLPLWGVVGVRNYTQGAALGYEVFGLSGRNK